MVNNSTNVTKTKHLKLLDIKNEGIGSPGNIINWHLLVLWHTYETITVQGYIHTYILTLIHLWFFYKLSVAIVLLAQISYYQSQLVDQHSNHHVPLLFLTFLFLFYSLLPSQMKDSTSHILPWAQSVPPDSLQSQTLVTFLLQTLWK